MDLQIDGLDATLRTLAELPQTKTARALAKALDRGIGVIAGEVEARTPEYEEGLLQRSVTTKVQVDVSSGGGSAAVGFTPNLSERTGKAADLIAFWVEFGHDEVSHHGQHVGEVTAHPFLRPAFDSTKNRALEVFTDVFIESLTQEEN